MAKTATRNEALFIFIAPMPGVDFLIHSFVELILNHFKIVLGLRSHPKLRRVSKETRWTQGDVGRDGALTEYNFVDVTPAYMWMEACSIMATMLEYARFRDAMG